MIRQTVFSFKFRRRWEKITARRGLALFAEFFKAMGLEGLIERYFPKPRSGRGFIALRYIKALCLPGSLKRCLEPNKLKIPLSSSL